MCLSRDKLEEDVSCQLPVVIDDYDYTDDSDRVISTALNTILLSEQVTYSSCFPVD